MPQSPEDRLDYPSGHIGKAISNPAYLELLDLLSHGEQSVEQFAEQTASG